MGQWETQDSRVVYENPWMIVHEDKVIRPDGKDGIYGYIESKSPSVYVVPLDEDNNTWIVKQYRYPLKREQWECVAGHIDAGESKEAAAKRELLEETGLEATDIKVLHTINAGSGIANFPRTICIARGLTKVSDQLDASDGILHAKKLPLSEVCGMIVRGEIPDATSIAAFLMVQASI